jgi:predicted component of type VI protein secretion system
MRRTTAVIVLLVVGLALGGCSFKRKPKPVDLCLHGDPRLQWYDDAAHTLYVRAYPLEALDGFAATAPEVLLAEPPPEVPGAAGRPQSRMLSPGGEEKLTLERKDGDFPHVGIVAGYYDLRGQGKMVVATHDLRRGSWLRRRPCYVVEFGPAGIQEPLATK